MTENGYFHDFEIYHTFFYMIFEKQVKLKHHSRARNIIECAIFLRALEIRPLFGPKVIGACCILHNICVTAGDMMKEEGESHGEDDNEEDTDNAAVDERDLSGNRLREQLAAQLSAPEQLPVCLGEHDCI